MCAWEAPRTWTSGELVTASLMNSQLKGNLDVLKTPVNDSGQLEFTDATELTIASGVVTVTQNYHKIDVETGSSDDLDTITVAGDVAAGFILHLRPESGARTIVLKNGTTGSDNLNIGADITLDEEWKTYSLVLDSDGDWRPFTIDASAAVGGSDTQVQYNDGGSAFGGDAGLVYNDSTDVLTSGKLATTDTSATSIDVAGGITAGTGNVALVGTDGKISGPLSSTIIDDLSGANLTTLAAGNISSGTVATARLGSGTASSSTFLRGDGAWETPAGGATSFIGAANGSTTTTADTMYGTTAISGLAITDTIMCTWSFTNSGGNINDPRIVQGSVSTQFGVCSENNINGSNGGVCYMQPAGATVTIVQANGLTAYSAGGGSVGAGFTVADFTGSYNLGLAFALVGGTTVWQVQFYRIKGS